MSDGYEVFADDLTPSARWQQWDWNRVIPKILGQWTINSQWGGDLWHMMPRYIRHGYIFRDMVKAMPDYDLPQSEVDNMKNEVKFPTLGGRWLRTMAASPSSPTTSLLPTLSSLTSW